jgi:hypothetical protein
MGRTPGTPGNAANARIAEAPVVRLFRGFSEAFQSAPIVLGVSGAPGVFTPGVFGSDDNQRRDKSF